MNPTPSEMEPSRTFKLVCGLVAAAFLAFSGSASGTNADPGWPFTTVSADVHRTDTIVATGDFTGDGHVDVLTRGLSGGNLRLSTGDGAGGFSWTDEVRPTVRADDLEVSDVNTDGNLDLIVAGGLLDGSGRISISTLLGDGAGSFTQSDSEILPSAYMPEIEVGDVNGDGDQDLIARAFTPPDNSSQTGFVTLKTVVGDGTGHFEGAVDTDVDPPPVPISPGEWSVPDGPMAAGDFNGDARIDLTFNYMWDRMGSEGTLLVLDGKVDGGFTTDYPMTPDPSCDGHSISDVNGDGFPDIIGNGADATLSNCRLVLWLNDGTGAFSEPVAFSNVASNFFPPPATADFDGDGALDVAAVGWPSLTPPGVYFWAGHGDGTFATALGDHDPRGSSIGAGDFDEDGHPDIVVSQDEAVVVYRYSGPPPPAGHPQQPEEPQQPAEHGLQLSVVADGLPTNRRALRRGFGLEGSCSPGCTVHVELTVGARVARRLGSDDRLLASGDRWWPDASRSSIHLRPSATVRRALLSYRGHRFPVRASLVAETELYSGGAALEKRTFASVIRGD